jgi:hypothetical protein
MMSCTIFDDLNDTYHYNLAGVGEPTYHLGGKSYTEDEDSARGTDPYIKKILANSSKLFELPPKWGLFYQ